MMTDRSTPTGTSVFDTAVKWREQRDRAVWALVHLVDATGAETNEVRALLQEPWAQGVLES